MGHGNYNVPMVCFLKIGRKQLNLKQLHAIAILYHTFLDQSFFNSWEQECNLGKIWPENNNYANLVLQSELYIT